MKPRRPSPCVLATLFATLAFAAPALRAAVLTGRVLDQQSGAYLAGAMVRIVGTDQSATTDSEGRFAFPNAPAGPQRLTADYLGYDPVSLGVSVAGTGTTTTELAFTSGIVRLEALKVEGYREGRAKALQQKRTADNIMDIVSADSVGNLPDRNVAEAVARLPGLNLSLDQGEGRYVSIRGAEPNLNQVMVDGATMAAPGGTRLGRAVPLDTLSAGQVASIEVIKSVTPDLDANSIGGTLNLKSASAFDRKGRFIGGSVAGNRNGNADKDNLSAQASYSDVFGARQEWGLAASVSYEKRNYQNEWAQFGWSLVNIGGTPTYLPNDFQIKPEWGSKTRKGLNLNLEFRPSAETQLYFRPGLSRTENPETRFEVIYTPSTAPANITFTGPRAGTINAGNRSERRAFRYRVDQDLDNYVGGFKQKSGPFTVEGMATHSHAKENRLYTTDREFRNATGQTGPIVFDLGNGFVPVRWDVDPAIDVPARYPLRRTRDDYGLVEEKIYTGKLDLRWDSNDLAGHPGYLKAGYKFLKRDRVTDLESRRLVPAGAAWNLADTGPQLASRSVYNGRFQSLFLPNIEAIDAFISTHPAQVAHDLAGESTNSIEDDYQISEFIYAAYAMGGIKLGNLRLLGGVRWEKTSATIRAVEERTIGNGLPVRIPNSGVKNYDKLFPNLQGTYRLTDDLQLRAAYTTTIGRPAYEDARSLAIFNYSSVLNPVNPQFGNTGSVTVGNPRLKPYGARSFDLSLEWYASKTGGVFSLAAFRKDIRDPIYTFTESQLNVVYSGVGLQSLSYTGKLNGTSGRISGLELNVHQPFRFLPAPFDGFGIDGNLTTISSSEVIPTRPGEDIPFFRQPGKIRNLTLFYERAAISARIAYTYASEQINTLGSNLIGDRYNRGRKQYDAQARYRFTKNYSLTAAVRNLTREPDELSYGIKSLVQSSRLLDRDYKLELNFNF